MKHKKIITIILLVYKALFSNAQEKEKSILENNLFGVETGIFGAWLYYETNIYKNFTLKIELGIDGSYSYSSYNNPSSKYFFIPSISAEPRWYYNVEKRLKEGKNTSNNSANFLSIRTTYNPNIFIITNSEDNLNGSVFRFIPSWGFKRNIGSNFNLELRLGFGYVTAKSIENTNDGFIPDFNFRFGYVF
jgi:hypothetical protein